MKIKVLVVEDNTSLNKSIVNMLQKEGYNPFSALDINTAREKFIKEKPHIVLLDVMLPQGNGYDLIPFFRKHHDCRIIILTALDDKQNKYISYKKGTDDYITKPFDLYELIYKLNAVRRRIYLNLKECSLGDITFNIYTNKVSCKEKTIIIQPSQVRFLKLLYDKYLENSYVDKTEFFESLYNNVHEIGRLQTLVARLRKNLSYVGSKKVEIETVYGKGYRIVVEDLCEHGVINE